MKRNNKLDRPIPELAQIYADNLICRYGISHAEIIAKLGLEKIRASRKSLNRKYGSKK